MYACVVFRRKKQCQTAISLVIRAATVPSSSRFPSNCSFLRGLCVPVGPELLLIFRATIGIALSFTATKL